MSTGDPSLKKKNLKAKNLREISSPGKLTNLLVSLSRLERQLDVLLQKMDLDAGISDTDYEATIEAVE